MNPRYPHLLMYLFLINILFYICGYLLLVFSEQLSISERQSSLLQPTIFLFVPDVVES